MTSMPNPYEAQARVTWVTADNGGRSSGPPVGPTYAMNVWFGAGPPNAQNDDPANGLYVSAVMNFLERQDHHVIVDLGFLVPRIASQYMMVGITFAVMEGPKVVGHGTVTKTYSDHHV